MSDAAFVDDEIYLAFPGRCAVLAFDAESLEPKRTYQLAPTDDLPRAPEAIAVAVAGASVVVASQRLESHGGDLSTTLHVFGREDAVLRQVLTPDADTESRWAVSGSGRTVLIADEKEDKRGVLRVMARIHGAATPAPALRFPVTAEDLLECDAVCLDDDGARAAFATEGGVIAFAGKKKLARWARPARLSALRFARHSKRVLGIEQGSRGVLWMMHPPKSTPPVTGALLDATGPVHFIAVSADERRSLWVARSADGTRRVFLLGHEHGETKIADDFEITASDEALVRARDGWDRLCWLEGQDLVVRPFAPRWVDVSEAPRAPTNEPRAEEPSVETTLPLLERVLAKPGKARRGSGLREVTVVSSNLPGVDVGDRLLTPAIAGETMALKGVDHVVLGREDLVAVLDRAKKPCALGSRVVMQSATPSSAASNPAFRAVVVSIGADAARACDASVGETVFFGKYSYANYVAGAQPYSVARSEELLAATVQNRPAGDRIPLRPLGARIVGRRVSGHPQTMIVEVSDPSSSAPPAGASVLVSEYAGVDITLDDVDYVVVDVSDVVGMLDVPPGGS